ncbi:MAG: HD-GYP domain-containing protein [Clostridia bacterium]|nr:HD-GYP domain-containing protein [Clostridia bacterium]
MRRMQVESLVPGMKLAKTIFTSDGRILLASGIELKDNFIDRLKLNGITEIFIEDEISSDVEVVDVVSENTRLEAKQIVKNLMEQKNFADTLSSDKVKELINKIIDELLANDDILVNLANIKSVDDYTFEHSVNVCILSLITGIGLGLKGNRLKDLGVGALLHDIGKLRIPEEILKKPSQLTVEEFEEIKKHTVYGYEILKDHSNINMVSAFIAFGHHERFDGSGYPLQLRGDNIHQCARIVAIADVYDALTSDRVYRRKLRPHEVIEYITSLGSHHFDKEIVQEFIKYIAVYPIGTGVVLNTRERGLVIRADKNLPTRPVVRVVFDKNSQRLPTYYDVDLSKKLNVFIMDSCEL